MHVALAGVTVCALAITLEAFGEHDSDPIAQNGLALIQAGRQTFRFDTFGDEEYWGDTSETASKHRRLRLGWGRTWCEPGHRAGGGVEG